MEVILTNYIANGCFSVVTRGFDHADRYCPFNHISRYLNLSLLFHIRHKNPSREILLLLLLLLLRHQSSATLAAAEQATFERQEGDGHENGDQEADGVQGVILYSVEVMGRGPQVVGPLVSHDEPDPEHRQIQGLDGTVPVHRRQLHHILFVTRGRRGRWEEGGRGGVSCTMFSAKSALASHFQ